MGQHFSLQLLIVTVFLSVSFFISSNGSISADVEPNDSLDTPEIISDGTYDGNVSSNGDDGSDIYQIDIPTRFELKVTIVKRGTEGGRIGLEMFDQEKSRTYDIILSVYTAGESDSDSWMNDDSTGTVIYLKVEGNGNYRLSISRVYHPPKQHSTRDSAEMIGEGVYSGNVSTSLISEDRVYYRISVPAGNELHVHLTFIESYSSFFSMMSLEGELSDGTSGWMIILLLGEGDSDEGAWINHGPRSEDYYLMIEGDGEYRMEVSLRDASQDEFDQASKIMLNGTIIVCCGGLSVIALILVIIIAAILIRKRIHS